jgi:hypothetical protein
VDMASADLDETAENELDDQEDEDEPAGHTRRWVRYVMPVMVEVDCDTNEITSVVTLPGEVRLDRDDVMNLPARFAPPGGSPLLHRTARAGPVRVRVGKNAVTRGHLGLRLHLG